MASNFYFSPQARRDALDVALYIAEGNPDAADRFIDALENTCSNLASMPKIGALLDYENNELLDIRVMRASKTYSSYLIFYRIVKGGIEVIRILHAARDFPSLFRIQRR